MATDTCIGCGDQIVLQLSGNAQGAGRLTTSPIRLLCRPCSRKLDLEQKQHSGYEYVRHEDAAFLLLDRAFVHSDHPDSQFIYRRFP